MNDVSISLLPPTMTKGIRPSEIRASIRTLVAESLGLAPNEVPQIVPLDPNGRYSMAPCVLTHCVRPAASNHSDFCKLHQRHWREAGHPDRASWDPPAIPPKVKPNSGRSDRGSMRFDLRGLPDQLAYDFAVGILAGGSQVRPGLSRPEIVNPLVDIALEHKIQNFEQFTHELLAPEVEGDWWTGLARSFVSGALAFLVHEGTLAAQEAILMGSNKVPIGIVGNGTTRYIDLSPVKSPDVKKLLSEWIAYRIASAQGSAQHVGQLAADFMRFAEFLDRRGVTEVSSIGRSELLSYLGEVQQLRKQDGSAYSDTVKGNRIKSVNLVLREMRELDLEPPIPPHTTYQRSEIPKRSPTKHRHLSEFVMSQLESPDALSKINGHDHLTALQIIMTTGMRINHTLSLKLDSLEALDAEGKNWCIHYLDTKANEFTRLPLSQAVADLVIEQQTIARQRFGTDCPFLFPSRGSRSTAVRHTVPPVLTEELHRWTKEIGLVDENGQSVKVTAHQFRHTCGMRWMNNGVSQSAVQQLLGHKSPHMTAVYAELTDDTVRAEWEKAQRVNIYGDPAPLPSDETLKRPGSGDCSTL